MQHPVRVCSWGNLGPARRSVCGSQAVRPGGCWHLASHLQLRVQPQVSGARDFTAFVYRPLQGGSGGGPCRGRGPLSHPRPPFATRAPPPPPFLAVRTPNLNRRPSSPLRTNRTAAPPIPPHLPPAPALPHLPNGIPAQSPPRTPAPPSPPPPGTPAGPHHAPPGAHFQKDFPEPPARPAEVPPGSSCHPRGPSCERRLPPARSWSRRGSLAVRGGAGWPPLCYWKLACLPTAR